MKPLYCSQGHDNPPNSRFCHYCGEALPSPTGGIYPGTILGDRYRIERELGHGGFGRTYLAKDINRFDERCTVKEFAPKVQGTYALQKAEELFEREAGVLYKLQHPQIPKFRELCRTQIGDRTRLFLVQDYVDGQTYRALLTDRKRQGQRFSEGEIVELLFDILPVLQYIHSRGVIHRDISPDNMIRRESDWLPVLIDFGGVKQVAATVESQIISPSGPGTPVPVATRLGKVGYAPEEQMQLGIVYPHSDLYALGVTVLVLLTGKEPQQLFLTQTLSWNWQEELKLNPVLEGVLNKMVAQRKGERYQSAREVLQALAQLSPQRNGAPLPPKAIGPTDLPTALPPEIPGNELRSPAVVSSEPQPLETTDPDVAIPLPGRAPWATTAVAIALVALAGMGGWWGGNRWVQWRANRALREQPELFEPIPSEPVVSSRYSPEELARKEALRQRRQQLAIDYNFYVDLVNEVFYEQYPEQEGRTLSYEEVDRPWRERWDAIADDLLDFLATLSESARQQLGNYGASDRTRWKAAVNRLHVSSRALFDLADAQFFHDFPSQRDRDFIERPLGQVWHAIAADLVATLESGQRLSTLRFDPGAFRTEVEGTLQPGEGRIYIASMRRGQIMRLTLQANSATLFSIYTPTGARSPLLEDSPDSTWSGQLPESGYYEFVVVSDAQVPVYYRLNLAADNVSSLNVE
ncbi:serine/threonine-protein kinase [Oxynema aestuarii]|uniref:serine/threonine-protein kinase n=1 Tax=Oxynema aestuarii TaxID=2874213 RepID=UPI001B30E4A7|nr:serine/threonine-protein kinase [Oxynema aestuarii]